MAFWSGEKLKEEMPSLVSDYSEDQVDCAAYTLRMGKQYYLSASEEEAEKNKLKTLPAGESLTIPSGQFAVLLTEESITVPPGKLAFISIRTRLKSRGLVNVSGFHVDPGYSAPLRFAVFNAGPSPIGIKQGDPCFLIWYADLERVDTENIKSDAQNRIYQRGITPDDVATLMGAVKTINLLSKKVDDLEKSQELVRTSLAIIRWVGGILLTVLLLTMGFLIQEGIKSYMATGGRGVSTNQMPNLSKETDGLNN